MATRPTIATRIDRESRKVLGLLCELDNVDVSHFVCTAVRVAIERRLDELHKQQSFNVGVLHAHEPKPAAVLHRHPSAALKPPFTGCGD